MKRKILFTFIFILFISINLCLLTLSTSAASPPATLTIDGVFAGDFTSVQDAIDAIALNPGSNFIVEVAEGTVSDNINILQLTGKNVVLKPQAGANVVFTNTITIDGNGDLLGEETLLIEGFTFDFTAGTYQNCIDFNLIPPHVGHSYPHNVTINGCTFMGILDFTVAVQSIPGGMRNFSIMNSTATDMHSLAQLKAVSGYAFIQNCVLRNSSGGVNFYGPGDLIIDSCSFEVLEYAVRSGQNAGALSDLGSVTVNNSVLSSSSATVGTIVLRGDSTKNINIIHSNVTNENGAFLQNLNAVTDEYNIDIIESNVTGSIAGIELSTIRTIDAPNVENGPVCISGNGPDNGILAVCVVLILSAIFLMIIALIIRLRNQ